MEQRRGKFETDSSNLPPREYWLFDPGKDDPIPTPVDEYGLVIAEELIAVVKSSFDPSYIWKSALSDEHHLYYDQADYPNIEINGVNPAKFRCLKSNRIIVQRDFHEAAHLRMAKPLMPCDETMLNQIKKQKLMSRLFSAGIGSVRLTRKRYLPDEKLKRGEEFHLNDYYNNLEIIHDTLPEEFRPRELDNLLPRDIEELHEIVPTLGRLAMTGKYVRYITQPAVALSTS